MLYLYDSIAIMIKVANLEFDKLANQVLLEYDLTPSQFKILKFLTQQPELSVRQIDIEQYFAMTNPSVTGILQNLEKKNLIERVPNPEDRRSKVIQLTDKLRGITTDLQRIGSELESRFTGKLDEGEKEQLKRLLRKLMDK